MSFKNKNLDLTIPDRKLNLAKKIIIVDGMIGGGKNLLSSIFSSLPNVEMWIHRPHIEQVCALHHLGHLSNDAAKALINTWLEEDILNQNMSRNVNFKPSDISSIFFDARRLRYFKRLFKSPQKAKESVEKERPILNLMTHVNTSYSKPLFEAIGQSLVYVRVSRHPMTIDMLKHNMRWTERWGVDDRHAYILYKSFDQNNNSVHLPFFAKNIEKDYLASNPTDKSILLFDQWIRKGDEFIDKTKLTTKANIIEIPFEKFVFEPEKYIEQIAMFLEVKPDNKTNKMMRKHNVPRSSLSSELKDRSRISETFSQGRSFAAKSASSKVLSILDKLAEDYEERHNINI